MEEQEEKKQKVIVVGTIGNDLTNKISAIQKSLGDNVEIVVVDNINDVEGIKPFNPTEPKTYTLTNPYKNLPLIQDFNTPNGLHTLRSLNLSAEQIEYIKNSPPQRLEEESQEDYKNRRMLNKLIIKYRGQL